MFMTVKIPIFLIIVIFFSNYEILIETPSRTCFIFRMCEKQRMGESNIIGYK